MAVENSPARIGKTVIIRGEVKGSEDLIVDGRVEGTVSLSEARLTVGPNANVEADLSARDVLVLGKVQGNVVGQRPRPNCAPVASSKAIFAPFASPSRITPSSAARSTSRRPSPRDTTAPTLRSPAASFKQMNVPLFCVDAALATRGISGCSAVGLKGNRTAVPSPLPRGWRDLRGCAHSGGWAAMRKRLQAEPGLRVIDTGYTSPSNINYLTGLGHSVFLADLVHDACTGNWIAGADEDGNPVWSPEAFLDSSLKFTGRTFDVVFLWATLDYLPEPLVAPVVDHLFSAMNPGGQILAFFHTRAQGDETVHCRYHLTAADDVEFQLAQPFPIQRAFTNRNIQRLFASWSGLKQFLAKDSILEVIITR